MFTSKNLMYFEMARPYFTWTIQNALAELQKGKTVVEVYRDLMKLINALDLPLKIHKRYVQEVISFAKKNI
jgi:hypothetical protein